MRIDAHQHFWIFDPVRDSWISDEMPMIRKDFLPTDLKPLLEETGFDGCVAVQAAQSDSETKFLVALAQDNSFIKAVVGWIDLLSDDIERNLEVLQQYQVLKGFRHILQAEKDRAFMLRPDFKRGIRALGKLGFTFDLLVLPDQLAFTKELVRAFPDQKFVIDHLAKPLIKSGKVEGWEKDMRELARCNNVWCKLSGMVTEGDWHNWKQQDFDPYLDVVVDSFGVQRIMYGSDWPVCLVAASYQETFFIAKRYFSSFSRQEQEFIFGGNAVEFYQIN